MLNRPHCKEEVMPRVTSKTRAWSLVVAAALVAACSTSEDSAAPGGAVSVPNEVSSAPTGPSPAAPAPATPEPSPAAPAPSPAPAPTTPSGPAAYAFTAQGSDGATHTLASLTKDGPVLLYFIKHDCPINNRAIKYYNRIGAAYPGTARVVGVINGDKALYEKWAATGQPTYPVLFDPEQDITDGFRVKKSPWVVMVNMDGTVGREWNGYSVGQLGEINTATAGAAGVPAATVDLGGAPEKPTAG
jgi:peroxiredoxin